MDVAAVTILTLMTAFELRAELKICRSEGA